ncbi:4a-hydroxytetrahydrobiopterin dehydratase [Paracoccus aestuarii]|uniref:4a-hydroxytetrahydrobiopterin dehydratase n=1 Tax=Paracoccus aestuarii TaxID=453842 RepID=A0A419A2T5_9RHOB|nr:4a-hydroxytetrahydrobiopterin dehydratase [Paracoccus aestuarii]RJL07532.1 4a-hydroxytetrahydrobiopterin dehydratase [Paracoccus aestuarii]WCQ99046.1 4a-hydroxytetrahydrobiopterin dehydratase [Paracoccus aestuarii]
MTDLSRQSCRPCGKDTPLLTEAEIGALLADLPAWRLSGDGRALVRRFDLRGFAPAVEMANLAAWLGNRQGHHPDVAFGWGYCTVSFTTHAAGGLTRNDAVCAARLDALLA